MQDAIGDFISWVVTTPLSRFIQTELWVIPAVQTLHILCVALVFSAAAMVDFKLLGFAGKDQTLETLVQRFLPPAWIALGLLAITGALLIIAEPARSILAGPFQLKMALLLAVIILTVWFQRIVTSNASRWNTPSATIPAARVVAAVSLALWLAIIVAGRWIAYATPSAT